MLLYLAMIDTQEDKDKFTEVYGKYQHLCWYIANQILGDSQLAEDAVQDTFLALTRHLDKIEETDSPKTKKFLMTIAKSKAIDILRRNKGKTDFSMDEIEYDIPDKNTNLLEQYITKENYSHLLSCILELEESYRIVFEYKYIHQLSDREIGKLLSVTPKVVNVRFFRARKKLQEMLQREVDHCVD